MSMESLKQTFFAECEELIEAMTEGLDQVAEGEWDQETVNAIFRAVHSIKGAAGAFGLEQLVAFAHRYETVLDRIRSNDLEVNSDILRLITRSSDVLAELVELAQMDAEEVPQAYDGLLTELAAASGEDAAPTAAEPVEEAIFAPVAFAPLALDLGPSEPVKMRFSPAAAMYANGHEPERYLAQLSASSIQCDAEAVPLLNAFDFDQSYLTWSLTVEDKSEAEISTVFDYVTGLCDLTFDAPEPEAPPPIDLPVLPEPAAAKPAPAPAKKATPRQSQTTLRVDPERVDRLINTVGELIINQAVIAQKLEADGSAKRAEVAAALDDYRYLAREIQEAVMSIRAQPVKTLFQRMARVVREAGEATGKPLHFETVGENTEIDKTLIERLADPLTHMLRNAVDHGLEAPEKRAQTDKDAKGLVRLSAAHRSGHVVIEVADDGAGLNRERIFQKAVDNGLIAPDAKLSDGEIDNLLFLPGFSTAAEVTNLSGRGVGMDVVKTAISAIGGRISISSEPGHGSTFSISLPLTLAVLDGIVVSVEDETMVIPIASIIETILPTESDMTRVTAGEWVLSVRGSYVPVVSLSALLGFAPPRDEPEAGPFILVEGENNAVYAFAVRDIWDQRQIVIKSLEGNYGSVPGISAATILGDGQIALIIDPDAVIAMASGARFDSPEPAMEA